MQDYIEVNYLKLRQPIGEFYVSSLKWQDIIKIAEADIRTIQKEKSNDSSFDSYLGIQRTVSQKRVKEISEYVKTIDATFPTSVILHISSEDRTIDGIKLGELDPLFIENNLDRIETVKNIYIDKSTNKLRIRSDEKVAKILDGQHRIEGIKNSLQNTELFEDSFENFDLNVTIFVDLDIDDQAQVFSIINKAQTKVNKSLVYDLFEYAKHRSPQKTAHDIVRILNRKDGSPFYKKIKILGTAENKQHETIAQATFVELIMSYITNNPMNDRDLLKKSNIFNKHTLPPLKNEVYIFRKLFIEEKDEIILRNLWNYFTIIMTKWPNSWSSNQEGNILNKSTGLIALMRFMRPVVNKIAKEGELIPQEKFKAVFDLIDLEDGSFLNTTYIPGSSGQSKLFYTLNDFFQKK